MEEKKESKKGRKPLPPEKRKVVIRFCCLPKTAEKIKEYAAKLMADMPHYFNSLLCAKVSDSRTSRKSGAIRLFQALLPDAPSFMFVFAIF